MLNAIVGKGLSHVLGNSHFLAGLGEVDGHQFTASPNIDILMLLGKYNLTLHSFNTMIKDKSSANWITFPSERSTSRKTKQVPRIVKLENSLIDGQNERLYHQKVLFSLSCIGSRLPQFIRWPIKHTFMLSSQLSDLWARNTPVGLRRYACLKERVVSYLPRYRT